MKNREIKFRIWTGFKMEYNVMVGFLGAFYVQGMDEKDAACLSPFNTKYLPEVPLMQFAGQIDCDGKEVWEGDIVESDYLINEADILKGVVVWNNVLSLFEIEINLNGELVIASIYSKQQDGKNMNRKVIGNIYENPELL